MKQARRIVYEIRYRTPPQIELAEVLIGDNQIGCARWIAV
jgi:hypothetical protein